MRDYAELIEALRGCSDAFCKREMCPRFDSTPITAYECRDQLDKDAADAIEELQAAVPKWISVEERLPDYGERVLIMFKPLDEEECISIGWLTQYGFECYDDSVYFFRSVTHWMPLPEPPMED